jgi:hypothetical protein
MESQSPAHRLRWSGQAESGIYLFCEKYSGQPTDFIATSV